jgi:integrase
MPVRPLSNASINKTLKVLAQVLEDAVEFGHLEANPARGKRRRLKAARPRRTWLELEQVQALLAAAGDHWALLATMALAGLRVGELTSLRWRDVDLAGGKLRVADAKTEAGQRVVDVSPMLLDDLKLHKADSRFDQQGDFVFATSRGTERNRSNPADPSAGDRPGKCGTGQGGEDSDRGRHEPLAAPNVLRAALRGGCDARLR